MPTLEGQAFAAHMDALFVEASATGTTAVGVQGAFRNLVERIIDTRGPQQSSAPPNHRSEGAGASADAWALDRPRRIRLQQAPVRNPEGSGCGC